MATYSSTSFAHPTNFKELISFHDVYRSNIQIFRYLNLKYQVASDYLGLALLIQIGILSKKANGNPMKKSDIGLVNSGRSYSMLNTLSNNGWLEKLIAKRGFTFKLSKKGEQILNDYFILIQGEIRSNRVKY